MLISRSLGPRIKISGALIWSKSGQCLNSIVERHRMCLVQTRAAKNGKGAGDGSLSNADIVKKDQSPREQSEKQNVGKR